MATTTSTAPDARPTTKTLAENVKDTLESIVVAFILAFVFRAFIVEAFVIPTGSMAVTLYGNHVTKTCSNCGFEYAVGIAEGMSSSYHRVPVHCPNCETAYEQLDPQDFARPDSGDRILVHKWPFDVGGTLLGPKRWDVTVFKDPRDGTTNFIKRLVGLPGEVIEIIDGDVYAVPLDALEPELIEKMDQLRLDVYRLRLPENRDQTLHQRSQIKREMLRRYAEINEAILPRLEIQRKIPHVTLAQESLWFNVYDHDFLPSYAKDSTRTVHRVGWEPTSPAAAQAWNTQEREIVFSSTSTEPLEIRLTKEITDAYAYNIREGHGGQGRRLPQHVGDVRLRFIWFPDSGQGALRLWMNRDQDEFTATIAIDGQVKVESHQPGLEAPLARQTIGEKKLDPFVPGRAVAIEFINLDYRVALFVDGEEVIASTPEQYRPHVGKLRRLITASLRETDGYLELRPTQVRIAASNMTCRLRHVVVERDVYYRSQTHPEEFAREPGGKVEYNPYYTWPGWGTAGLPLMLRKAHTVNGQQMGAEYFMLGDNSPESKDSRLWWEIGPPLRRLGSDYQVGTVPDDQLIGKAFFVYWPAGYRPSWSPRLGLIPNFGRMRWIR